MSRPRKLIAVGVRVADGNITPERLQRIGGKLASPVIAELINNIRRGRTKSFAVDIGDGVSVICPYPDGCTMKVYC